MRPAAPRGDAWTRFWILDSGFWILGSGIEDSGILGSGIEDSGILDSGFWILDTCTKVKVWPPKARACGP